MFVCSFPLGDGAVAVAVTLPLPIVMDQQANRGFRPLPSPKARRPECKRHGNHVPQHFDAVMTRRQGLKEADVLVACRKYMYHKEVSGDGCKSSRFVLEKDQSGQWAIQVLPKRRRDGALESDSWQSRFAASNAFPAREASLNEKLSMSLDELVTDCNWRPKAKAA